MNDPEMLSGPVSCDEAAMLLRRTVLFYDVDDDKMADWTRFFKSLMQMYFAYGPRVKLVSNYPGDWAAEHFHKCQYREAANLMGVSDSGYQTPGWLELTGMHYPLWLLREHAYAMLRQHVQSCKATGLHRIEPLQGELDDQPAELAHR